MNELNCIFPGIKNNDFEIENACKNLKKKNIIPKCNCNRAKEELLF